VDERDLQEQDDVVVPLQVKQRFEDAGGKVLEFTAASGVRVLFFPFIPFNLFHKNLNVINTPTSDRPCKRPLPLSDHANRQPRGTGQRSVYCISTALV